MLRGACLVAAVLLALAATTLSTQEAGRADFTYVNPSGIHTLDPARASWLQDFRLILNLWEGLTTWDPQTLEPIAGAAELPPHVSNDRLTYTFRIRDDARWSNGDPLTAHDFVRGWRRAMEPGTAADYRFFFTDYFAGAAQYVAWRNEGVASLPKASSLQERDQLFDAHARQIDGQFSQVGIQALDDATLVMRLSRPCPYLLDLLAFPTFMPVHQSIDLLRESHRGAPLSEQGLVVYSPQWTQPGTRENGYAGLVTNGPYALSDWVFKRRARLQLNPHYHSAGDVRCRVVDMLDYDNVSASLMAYDAGKVDFLTDLSVPFEHELYRLSAQGLRTDLKPCQTPATYFFNFNCSSATVGGRKNPFLDSRVRRAFTLATDRRSIVDHVRRRGDRAAGAFVPPGAVAGYDPPPGLPYDPAQAQAMLREAGYASGRDLGPVEILYPPRQAKVCQALARMWEQNLGTAIELRALESKTFAEEKAHQRFMVAWGNWYADYNDPTTFLDCFASGNGNNDSGYANSRYDQILARAAAETDTARRMSLLQEAERIAMHEECPVLPILHPTELIAVAPRVRGIYSNSRLWFPFRHVSVAP